MYGYTDNETRRAGCMKAAEANREAAALFPQLRKTFEEFDGKVFNCRLEKALQEATGRRVYVKKDSYKIEVYTYIDDHSGSRWYTLAFVKNDELKDGKRIPAAAFISSAREARERYLQNAAAMDDAAERGPEIKRQIEYFIEQANNLVNALPYSAQEIYHVSRIWMH